MKAKIMTLLLALMAPAAFAQDYSLFNSEHEITYNEGEPTDHRILKLSGFEIEDGDTIFETYHQPGGLNCAQSDGPSWLGSEIIKTAEDQTLFKNLHDQEIIFENLQLLSPGDSWTCWQSDMYYVKATIMEVTEESFLYVTDSVKIISFQKYNNDDELVSSLVNDKIVKVSKYYGMTQTLPWVMFPDIPLNPEPTGNTPTYPESGTEYWISGSTQLNAGMNNLTAREIFDFEIGDVFHILDVLNRLPSTGRTDTVKSILRVIDKTLYADSVTYEYERELNDKSLEFQGEGGPLIDSSLIYIHDTIEETYFLDPYLNRVPFETAYQYNDDSTQANAVYHHLFVFDADRRAKNTAVYGLVQWMWHAGSECLDPYAFDGCGPYDHYYIDKLGGPYHDCLNWIDGSVTREELVYFEQNGEIWGDPFDNLITHDDGELETEKYGIRVYPNPASSEFIVEAELSGQVDIMLYNDIGNLVYSEKIAAGKNYITPNVKPGIYFYQIMQNSQTIHSGKILLK